MASSSRQTLPPSGDSKDSQDIFLSRSNQVKKKYEKITTDPEYIQFVEELTRLKREGNEFYQEQSTNILVKGARVMKRLCADSSLESFVNHRVIENYAEHLEYMRKDPEVKHIFAALDNNGPAAIIMFCDDEDVLKKLGKALRKFETSTLGHDVETSLASGGNKDDDDVSEGRKVLEIVCEFGKMKCLRGMLKSKRKGVKAVREAA